jgi:hypothetical protein
MTELLTMCINCGKCTGNMPDPMPDNFCDLKCYDSFISKQEEVIHPSFLNKPYRVHPSEYDMELITKENPATCGIHFMKDGKIVYCNKIAAVNGARGYQTCREHSLSPNDHICKGCEKCVVAPPGHSGVDAELFAIGKTGAEYKKIAIKQKMKYIMDTILQRANLGLLTLSYSEPIPKELAPVLRKKQICVSEDLKTLSW